VFELLSGRSLWLAAFVTRNGPQDHFVRLRRTVPHPTRREAPGGGRCPPAGLPAEAGRGGQI